MNREQADNDAALWWESNADMTRKSGGDKEKAIKHYAEFLMTGNDDHRKIAENNLPKTDTGKLFSPVY